MKFYAILIFLFSSIIPLIASEEEAKAFGEKYMKLHNSGSQEAIYEQLLYKENITKTFLRMSKRSLTRTKADVLQELAIEKASVEKLKEWSEGTDTSSYGLLKLNLKPEYTLSYKVKGDQSRKTSISIGKKDGVYLICMLINTD